ncbi:MAG: hypothetical protein AB8H47_23090 [Bacteroidia bacterium]
MAIKVGVQPEKDAFALAQPILSILKDEGGAVEILTVTEPWEALEQKNIQFFVSKAEPFLLEKTPLPLFVSRRASLREVIVAKDKVVQLENFAGSWKIGVFSRLHQALLKRYFGHIEAILIDTQLAEPLALLDTNTYDGLMLSQATVDRLGISAFVTQRCNPHTFPSVLGQGLTLGFEGERSPEGTQIHSALHRETEAQAWLCEKSFARQMPIVAGHNLFGLASVIGDSISMRGGWISDDGKEMVQTEVALNIINPNLCAQQLVEKLQEQR